MSAWDMLASRRADTHWDCDVRVSCSSGTYIRALARDLGASLGVGGHLTALRRTWVGDFAVTEPTVVRDPVTATHEVSLSLAAAACRVLLSIPVTEAEATQLRHGRTLPLPEDLAADALAADGLWAAVRGDTLIAIVTARDGRLRVATGFPGEGS